MTVHQTDPQLIQTTNSHINQLLVQVKNLQFLNARRQARIAAKHGTAPGAAKWKPEFGIDYAEPVTDTRKIKRIGATFVCRYLASHPGFHNPKDLTPQESLILRRAGIKRVVVWETTADRARSGHLAGVQDAENALREARACSMPEGRPIYFAVDFDADGPEVLAYFQGVRGVLGNRTGCYAGFRPIRFLFTKGVIDWGWQTYAWSQGQWYRKAQLQQYSNDHNMSGIGVDYDRTTAKDFGQW